jgi:hypothetical protein
MSAVIPAPVIFNEEHFNSQAMSIEDPATRLSLTTYSVRQAVIKLQAVGCSRNKLVLIKIAVADAEDESKSIDVRLGRAEKAASLAFENMTAFMSDQKKCGVPHFQLLSFLNDMLLVPT